MPMAALAVDPLSRSAAEAAKARLMQLQLFSEGHLNLFYTNGINQCTEGSQNFSTQCTNVAESTCKLWQCSDSQYTTQATCEGTDPPNTWSDHGDAPNGVCCSDGDKECKYDAAGNEIFTGVCCDMCLNTSHPLYSRKCVVANRPGVAICGTTQGHCYSCTAGSSTFYADDESSCLNFGSCTVGSSFDRSSCESSGGVFTPATWNLVSSATTEAQCKVDWVCKQCTGCGNSCPGDERSCLNTGSCSAGSCTTQSCCQNEGTCDRTTTCATGTTGDGTPTMSESCCTGSGTCTDGSSTDQGTCEGAQGTWTAGVWTVNTFTQATAEIVQGANEDNCWDGGSGRFMYRPTKWVEGNTLPASPMLLDGSESCATGPSHSEPSHLLPDFCIDHQQFLNDALAGMTAQQAVTNNATYYRHAHYLLRTSRAQVVNHANAVMRAEFHLLPSVCFVTLFEPFNHGKVTMTGGPSTYALVLNPMNYADADQLQILGSGSATVLGGSNAGAINSTTNGILELYGIANTGNVYATVETGTNGGIIIASVTNGAAATIDITDLTVTLIDIVNEGNVIARGSSGKYNAYDITNTGTVTIKGGQVDLHFTCNSGGTIVLETGVIGTLSYPTEACRGSITAPSTVTVSGSAALPARKLVTGSLSLTSVTVTQAQSMETEIKNSLARALAGVSAADITIISITASASSGGRRLTSGTGVDIVYSVETGESTSALVQSAISQTSTQEVFLEQLKTEVASNADLTAALESATVTFTTPTVADAPQQPTGSASDSRQVSIGFGAVATTALAVLARY